jgi:uncharacterized membrane protein
MSAPLSQEARERRPRVAPAGLAHALVARTARHPRWLLFAAGVTTLWAARRKPGVPRALLGLLGAGLIAMGARRSAQPAGVADLTVHRSVSVRALPMAAYDLWREPNNLLRFMHHVADIEPLTPTRARWILKPFARGPRIAWEAQLVDDVPGEVVTWQSSAGEPMRTSLSVMFRARPIKRLTEVTLRLQYVAQPDGAVQRALRPGLELEIASDLRRFKQLLETGELPTTRGQSSARAGDAAPWLEVY